MVLFGFCLVFATMGQGFRLEGIPSLAIPVTVDKMTNLVFPEAVQAGVKVSKEVIVQKVRGVENVIEIKALRRDFTATNLSVYGKDGRLYSFVLKYVADDSVLNFRVVAGPEAPVIVTGLPAGMDRLRETAASLEGYRGRRRPKVSSSGLTVRLAGIYSRDSLEWLVVSVSNRSGIDFGMAGVRYYVEERKMVKRRAVQEQELQPVFTDLVSVVGNRRTVKFAAAFEPIFVGKGKRMVVEVRGEDGRVVRLRVRRVRAQ